MASSYINRLTLNFKDKSTQSCYDQLNYPSLKRYSIVISSLMFINSVNVLVVNLEHAILFSIGSFIILVMLLLLVLVQKQIRLQIYIYHLIYMLYVIFLIEHYLVPQYKSWRHKHASLNDHQIIEILFNATILGASGQIVLVLIYSTIDRFLYQSLIIILMQEYIFFRIQLVICFGCYPYHILVISLITQNYYSNYLRKKMFIKVQQSNSQNKRWKKIMNKIIPLQIVILMESDSKNRLEVGFINHPFRKQLNVTKDEEAIDFLRVLQIQSEEEETQQLNSDNRSFKLIAEPKDKSDRSIYDIVLKKMSCFTNEQVDTFINCHLASNQQSSFPSSINTVSNNQIPKHYDVKLSTYQVNGRKAVLVIINDVSQVIRHKQMQLLANYKSKILENMSHNLKTPLNGLMLYLQVLKDSVPASTQVGQIIKTVDINAAILQSFINDIIDYNQIQSNQLFLDISRFPLAQVIQDIQYLFTVQALKKRIALNIKLDGVSEAQLLTNDYGRIRQVIINLLTLQFDQGQENNQIDILFFRMEDDPNVICLRFDSEIISNLSSSII